MASAVSPLGSLSMARGSRPGPSRPVTCSYWGTKNVSTRPGPEPDIPLLKIDGKTDSERHQSKIRQQKPGGRVAQLGPSGPGGEFVRAELAAL